MNCPNCGTQYENSTFCPNCGAPAPEVVDSQSQQYYEQVPNNQENDQQQYNQQQYDQQQYAQQPNENYVPQQPYSTNDYELKKSKLGLILAFVAVAVVAALIGGFIGSAITKSNIAKNAVSSSETTITNSSYGNETSSSSQSATADTSQNVVLYDDNDVRITFTGVKIGESSMRNGLTMLIENNTANKIRVRVDSFSIDGFTISGYLDGEDIGEGKKSNTTLSISPSELSDNGLDMKTLKDVEVSFKIYLDASSYSSSVTTDTIKIPVEN